MWIEKFCSGDKNWLNKEEKKASIFGFRIAIPKPSLKWFNVMPDGATGDVDSEFIY